MIIGRDLTDENKYLNNTIKKIHELLDSYGVSSKEQDKEIINHRKFLRDNTRLHYCCSSAEPGD